MYARDMKHDYTVVDAPGSGVFIFSDN